MRSLTREDPLGRFDSGSSAVPQLGTGPSRGRLIQHHQQRLAARYDMFLEVQSRPLRWHGARAHDSASLACG